MQIVLQLPEVKRNKFIRPKKCPHCKGETFQSWGTVKKSIKDTKIRNTLVKRYKCTSCKKTFRHYPEGVTNAQQSERLMKLIVIMWSLGLSYRSAALLLSAFGVSLSHMSGWRDVQAEAGEIRRKTSWKVARVVGVDGAWLNGKGIMVAVDMGDGELLSVGQIDEKDMSAVNRWLRELKQRHEIGVIVTDDLKMYRGLSERLGLEHQVCQFHVRRWVGKACWELDKILPEAWLWVLDEIRQVMEDMPPDASKRFYELWKQMPGDLKHSREQTPVDRLRRLLIHLHVSWDRYTAFFHDPGIPWTNNQTEQMIGKVKMRAKSVRGYKTEQGRLNGLLVSSQSWT